MKSGFKMVEDYFSILPKTAQAKMRELRKAIRKAAPDAEEIISYRMPAFKQQGMLVFYAAHRTHVGFYPTPSGITAFKKELSSYKGAKGSVQFPMDKPLPLTLIARIVKFRVTENLARTGGKMAKQKISEI